MDEKELELKKAFAKHLEDQGYEIPQGFLPPEEVSQPNFVEKVAGNVLSNSMVQKGLKGLDYAGNVARTAIMAPLSEDVSAGDIVRAANPMDDYHAPSFGEVLKKNFGEGFSASDIPILEKLYSKTGNEALQLKKGGLLDPTVAGTIGTGLDIATDPLTYLSLGGTGVAKLANKLPMVEKAASVTSKVPNAAKAIATPIKTAGQAIGKQIYKYGLKPVEEGTEYLNRASIADELMNRGVWGSAKTVQKEIKNIADDSAKTVAANSKIVAESGAKVDTRNFVTELSARADKMKQSSVKEIRNAGEHLEEQLSDIITRNPWDIPFEKSVEIQQDLYKSLPKDAYGRVNKNSLTEAQKQTKALADEMWKANEKVREVSLPPEFRAADEKAKSLLASTYTVEKGAEKSVKNELRKAGPTQLSTGFIPLAMKDPTMAAAYALKEGTRALQVPKYATPVGLGVSRIAPYSEVLMRTPNIWGQIEANANQGSK